MIGGCTCPAVLELLCPVEVASPEASKEHLSTISTEGCVECEEGTFPFGALFLVLSNAIRYSIVLICHLCQSSMLLACLVSIQGEVESSM